MLVGWVKALSGSGFLEKDGETLHLTERSYDRDHDLERWVTYHFIEPLLGDMKREHEFRRPHLPELS